MPTGKKISEEKKLLISKLNKQGLTPKQIAGQLCISRVSVYDHLNGERNTYKYVVKQDDKIISMGRTYDFNKRACDIKARFPDATIKQIGNKTTWQRAEKWLRRQI